MSLTDAAFDQYQLLTTRTFYVVDTEYAVTPDGNHMIAIAIVPVVAGRRTLARDETYLVMNPGVPIDAATGAVHGFSDSDVARKPTFAARAPRILAALNDPTGVFVCHTGVDIHLLRAELTRLDERRAAGETTIAVGLADLPDLPIVDTSTLAGLTGIAELAGGRPRSLTALCSHFGITNTSPHHARADARATADVLTHMLKAVAATFSYDTLEQLLADHDRGTTGKPRIATVAHKRKPTEPDLPPAHLARHTTVLLDPAAPGQVIDFLAMADECVALHCRHLRDACELAAPANAHLLFAPLVAKLSALSAPGDAGTLLGGIARLLANQSPTTPALPFTSALKWLTRTRPTIAACTACTGHGLEACPDCRDLAGCPRDTIYQPIATIAAHGPAGQITDERAHNVLMGASPGRAVNKWADRQAAAYLAWLVIDWEKGCKLARADRHLALATTLDLHLLEPRLALSACDWLAGAGGDLPGALDVAEKVLAGRTSDRAYDDLDTWLTWARQSIEKATQAATARTITDHRRARPAGRVNANPYLPAR